MAFYKGKESGKEYIYSYKFIYFLCIYIHIKLNQEGGDMEIYVYI